MGVTHTFVSAIADGGDTSLVRPVDWNAGHTVDTSTFPGHEFAYAAIAADITTTSTTATDATGLTVTYTADGGAVIVEAYLSELRTTGNSGGDRRAIADLFDSTAGARIQLAIVESDSIANANSLFMAVRVTPAAGSQSFKVRYNTVAAGTATIRAAATGPSYIRVIKV